MEEWMTLLSKALFSALGIILTACAARLGRTLKGWLKEKQKTEAAVNVINACVKAVEQMDHSLQGEEKRRKATAAIRSLLAEKGISLSDAELRILLEAAVAELNGICAAEP